MIHVHAVGLLGRGLTVRFMLKGSLVLPGETDWQEPFQVPLQSAGKRWGAVAGAAGVLARWAVSTAGATGTGPETNGWVEPQPVTHSNKLAAKNDG